MLLHACWFTSSTLKFLSTFAPCLLFSCNAHAVSILPPFLQGSRLVCSCINRSACRTSLDLCAEPAEAQILITLCRETPNLFMLHLIFAMPTHPAAVCSSPLQPTPGKPGLPAVLLHLGPGLANGISNLHNARRARSRVLCLVGQMVGSRTRGNKSCNELMHVWMPTHTSASGGGNPLADLATCTCG
jgi:hypothetical protein